jgi:FtsH-binding integral membrane protein
VLVIASLRMPGVLPAAALTTVVAFAALTAVVFVTRKDFSFMRGILTWGGILALVLIVAATLFGFELGVFFSVAMVAFAGAAILYDTSNVLHHYPRIARRRGARAVRLGRAAVLVHPAALHEPQVSSRRLRSRQYG